jgi:polyisoprenoid-binding protein YceI
MTMLTKTIAVVTLSLAVLATGAVAAETSYHFGIKDQRSNVTFQSNADFEVTVGSTNKLTGMAKIDWEKGTGSVSLEVPVASLDTGIDTRNEHLRSEGWLDAATYPTIKFEAKEAGKVGDGKWKVTGNFTMHGQTKPLSTTVDVKKIPEELATNAGLEEGDWIRIRTEFEVKLSDYGVTVPDGLTGKVDDKWNITVIAFASSVPKG